MLSSMTIQRIILHGERYVILPEREFMALQTEARPPTDSSGGTGSTPPRYAEVVPIDFEGVAPSELLILDRR